MDFLLQMGKRHRFNFITFRIINLQSLKDGKLSRPATDLTKLRYLITFSLLQGILSDFSFEIEIYSQFLELPTYFAT